jgi:hypothetical protein
MDNQKAVDDELGKNSWLFKNEELSDAVIILVAQAPAADAGRFPPSCSMAVHACILPRLMLFCR